MGLFRLGFVLRHFLSTARGAYKLLLSGLGVVERTFRRDKFPPLATPHLHGHQLRLLQGVLGLVGHRRIYYYL